MATRLNKNHAGKVLYLYGITKAPARNAPEVAGIDGSAAVERIPCAGLVCWISRVSNSEFADNLSTNMENLEWLAAVSVRHQRVVSAIAQRHDILPTRFGTVFLSEDSLAEDVRARKRGLERDLKRVTGSDEWGIKVFRLHSRTEAAIEASSGKAYLQKKAALLRSRESKSQNGEIGDLAEALKSISGEMAYGGAVSEGQRGLQWQASVLLRRSNRKRLEAVIRKFAQQWQGIRRIECSGPWPPYSFVSRTEKNSTRATQ